jgi:hypothetical protein
MGGVMTWIYEEELRHVRAVNADLLAALKNLLELLEGQASHAARWPDAEAARAAIAKAEEREWMPKNRDELTDFLMHIPFFDGWAVTSADALLSALDKAGLCVVPKEATPEMIGDADPDAYRDGHARMCAASPFAVKP